MATPAQITANQANAQKSTGPRSVEGKSASRFNALKHGIDAQSIVIPGEDPADYDALAEAYHREYRPESPSEAFHIETMLRAAWQKLRLERVEADLTRTLIAESNGGSLAAALLAHTPPATPPPPPPPPAPGPRPRVLTAPAPEPTPHSAAPAVKTVPPTTRPSTS